MARRIGLGLGLQKGRLLLSLFDAQIYVRAAEAAGGTVESLSCVKASFQAFKAVNLPMYAKTQDYITKAGAEGGTVDSFSCIRKDFIALINISL